MDRNKAIEVLKDFWSVYAVGTEIREAFETLIPEIKESEDERIIGRIKMAIESYWSDEPLDEILAWLEKQGEQKVPVLDFKAKDWYVSKVDGKIHNIYHSVDKVEPKFKVGDVVRHKNGSTVTITGIDEEECCYYYDAAGTIHSDFGFGEECNWELKKQNPLWSEEDEKMIEFWNLYYEHKVGDMPNKDVVENLEKFRDWLKSIKNRVQPQPKQEWSQTDNELADDAIACVTRCYEEYKDNKEFYQSLHHNTLDIKRWLIDVRKRLTPHWKPSDEQMDALLWVIENANKRVDVNLQLNLLYEDLKRLYE